MPTKILAIDDDTALTDLLSTLLMTHGFEVVTANFGQSGIALAQSANPDLIILDLMMPDQDGWSVCQEIRAFSQAPIIVLSALNDPGMVVSALDAGADDYLVKPVPSNVLVAHINTLTRRAAAERNRTPLFNPHQPLESRKALST
jgi:DNA-binding response OmpR family regulator